MGCRASPELRGGSSLTLPVLVDEALVLCVRIDGRQSRRHLPVDLHHFMLQEGGDVEILLQDLLPWSRWCKWEKDRVTRRFDSNIFVTVAMCRWRTDHLLISHLSIAGISGKYCSLSI